MSENWGGGQNLNKNMKFAGLLAMLLVAANPGLAHVGQDLGGLGAGLLHPISGLDHIAAMVAVGLWGGILGAPAIWLLPVVFPLAMAVAGAFGAAGIPLPGVEVGIALSGVVLGSMVLFAVKPPLWIAAILVGVFAAFHGHAHGTELPDAANPMVYAVGFVVSTGLLHLIGIAIGQLGKWPAGKVVVRAAGAAIAVAGGAFLTGLA
jgi:urease accessory protein